MEFLACVLLYLCKRLSAQQVCCWIMKLNFFFPRQGVCASYKSRGLAEYKTESESKMAQKSLLPHLSSLCITICSRNNSSTIEKVGIVLIHCIYYCVRLCHLFPTASCFRFIYFLIYKGNSTEGEYYIVCSRQITTNTKIYLLL